MRLALYQPDIPQNLGAMLRLAACFGVGVDVIEPCGFPLDDKKIRRAGMDYLAHAHMARHASWEAFLNAARTNAPSPRLILLTTKAELCYTHHRFRDDDIVLVGRESAGVPDTVAQAADARVLIPMQPPARSLNVAMAAAIVLAEALRQTGHIA
ncbi:MAG: tRNA (cytidine(34)-2'-O)-methyltransferase [Alphaproteobacteria bacterium]|nr:tRNA (cytidine(34)-2'-O)-methyltransferase [Alphaproteobacteria bacterium]